LSVANGLWASLPLDPDFVRRAHELLAEARSVDLSNSEQARRAINEWVAHRTRNTITDLLPSGSISPDTRLVITNTIYFKAAWEVPFEPRHTVDADFHLLDNSGTKRVRLMHNPELLGRHARFEDHAMVALPYEGPIAMLVLLPHDNSARALQAVRGCPHCTKNRID
jgi:serpin B